jgi:tetratricopeptide (TPR) repeat protein
MCLVIKDDSEILSRLRVGDILDMKYHTHDPLSYPIHRETAIRAITKSNERQFRGHCLVRLEIIEEAGKGRRSEASRKERVEKHFVKAWRYYNAGQFEEALRVYTRLLSLDSKNALAHFNRSVVYLRLGAQRKAFEDLKKAAGLGHKKAREFLTARGVTS